MPIPERFNPGPEHVKAYADGEALAKEHFGTLMSQARAIWDAADDDMISPTVLHGTIQWCLTLSGHLVDAANSLHWSLDRDWVDLIRYENAFINGRFIKRDKVKPHIAVEIARLRSLGAR
jgi:hypothetical protein